MKLEEHMETIYNNIDIKKVRGNSYQILHDNLMKAKTIVDFVLSHKCKNKRYKTDVSEYFSLIIIRIDSCLMTIPEEGTYAILCKDFKELFLESGVEINIAILLGSIDKNDYYFSICC